MEILVKRNFLGIKKFDLLINEAGEVQKYFSEFSGKSKPDRLIVPSRDYWQICKLHNLQYRHFPPERFRRAYQAIKNHEAEEISYLRKDFPWQRVIPKKIYNSELKKVTNNLYQDFKGLSLDYYYQHYKKYEVLFKNLNRAVIDLELYEKFVNDGNENSSKAVLKTFEPKIVHNGKHYCNKVKYDGLSSITGRLVVDSGPNILHLRTDYRKIIKSLWGNEGSIYYLDFKSLEPRILLALKEDKEKIPKDIYLDFAKQSNMHSSKYRKPIKTCIISMMYGAEDDDLIRSLKGVVDYPEDFVKSIKEHFNVEELKAKLKDEYEKYNGQRIHNMYGRPILEEAVPPYILVNHFIQSSAVDVALQGFTKIVEKLKTANGLNLIRPLFVLHDALILDVHSSVEHLLPKIAKYGSKGIQKMENVNFWIGVEKL